MLVLRKGRYAVRFAVSDADLRRAQHLRHLAFRGPPPGPAAPRPGSDHCNADQSGADQSGADQSGADHSDADCFDTLCRHVLVEEQRTGALVCCFRLLPLQDGAGISRSYSAQHYDLSALQGFGGPMLEIGRFCLHPGWHDPDILRVAWGALVRMVDAQRVELLFGCSSFPGTDAAAHAAAFALLRARHLAPDRWRPGVKAARVVRFAGAAALPCADPKRAMQNMPPLLRSYLAMGGWVSDHAVRDTDMNTLHVFTGLEIRAIPAARARLLRAAAA